MNDRYRASSPHFFRPVRRCFWLALTLLAILAALLPAPLEEQANLAVAPNPAKSAWFLLWIQELVSYRIWLIYPAFVAGLLFTVLPWLIARPPETASWFGQRQRPHAVAVLLLGTLILALTVIGLYFRGENWSFVWPF